MSILPIAVFAFLLGAMLSTLSAIHRRLCEIRTNTTRIATALEKIADKK